VSRAAGVLFALLAGGTLAVGVAWLLGTSFERGTRFEAGSSFRSDGEGARGLYLVLEETGHHPRRLLERVPPREALLASLAAETTGPSRDQELVDWVRDGGHLVLIAPKLEAPAKSSGLESPRGSRQVSLAETLGLRLQFGAASAAPAADSPFAEWAGLGDEQARQHWSSWPRGARLLLGNSPKPVLVESALGAGHVTALAEPAFFLNAGLAHGDRLPLALTLLLGPHRPVVFDEYAHGVAAHPGLAYVLARYGLLPAFCAGLLFLGLLAWRTSPAEAEPAPGPPGGGEMRDSLVEVRAAIYARTLRPRDALRLLERDFRHGLAERLGSARPLPWRELERRLAERKPAFAPRLKSTLLELGGLKAKPPLRLSDTLSLGRQMAALLKEIG
jgi:hypothetical protein